VPTPRSPLPTSHTHPCSESRTEFELRRSAAARRRPCRIRRGLHALACVLLTLASLAAQQTPADSDGPPSVETIQARITSLEAIDAGAPGRETALVLWKQALDLARSAADSEARTSEFESRTQDAAAQIEAAREEIAALQEATVPPDASPPLEDAKSQELEAAVTAAAGRLTQASLELRAIEEAAQERSARQALLPSLIQKAQAKVDSTNGEPPPPADDDPAVVLQARRAVARLQRLAATRELAALQAETTSYTARAPLAPLRQQRAELREGLWSGYVDALRTRLNQTREREKQKAASEAEAEAQRLQETARIPERVNAPIAKQNAAYAEREAEIAARLTQVAERTKERNDQIAALADRFQKIKHRITQAGLTDAIGLQLRYERSRLPDTRVLQAAENRRRREISELQREQVQIETALRELDLDVLVAEREPLPERATQRVRDAALETTKSLLETREQSMQRISDDIDDLVEALTELDTKEKQLAARVDERRTFIDERVLWIRSSQPLWSADWSSLVDAARWFTAPQQLEHLPVALGEALATHSGTTTFAVLVGLLLLLFQRRIGRDLRRLGDRARQNSTTEYLPTLNATLWTVLHALPLPWLLGALGYLLATTPSGDAFSLKVGQSTYFAAFALFALLTLRRGLAPSGLVDAHFRWDERVRTRLRTAVTLGTPVFVTVVFASNLLDLLARNEWGEVPSRVVMVVGSLFGATLTAWALNPRYGALSIAPPQPGPIWRLRGLWYLGAVATPIAIALLSASGFHYSAFELARRIDYSAGLAVVAILVHALGLRYMLLAKRRLAVRQALDRFRKSQQRPKDKAADGSTAAVAREVAPPPDPERVDLAAVDAMSRSLLRTIIGAGVVVGLGVIWFDVFPALGYLDSVTLSEATRDVTVVNDDGTIGTRTELAAITLVDVILSGLVLLLTIAAARNLPGLLELTVLQRLQAQAGERKAVVTLARYAITTIGLIFAFTTIGIGWSNIQWLVAAVSVGLGFGLQEIFANFVSGLILLFERPVRVGDLVTVGTVEGYVTRIQIRATTILDFDNRELIVPNKELVTTQLINWTLTDPVTRIVIPVGIAYGSDTEKARELLTQVANEHPLILKKPQPSAIFRRFDDSCLLFELRIFIATRDVWLEVMHTIHTQIDQAFRAAGVEIAFPQRDLHIRSAPGLVEVFGRHGSGGSVSGSGEAAGASSAS
jgi:potassium efflux system protein